MLKGTEVICCVNIHDKEVIFLDYTVKGGVSLVIIYSYFLELW